MKNQTLKCNQRVRNIPLERYRLPDDGRKWKQAARSRSALLVRLSSYANGDGTFVRNGRNYSPSLRTLLKHVGHGSYYKLTDELHASGLLSWTREKHYERRIYIIHLPDQVQDSTENRSKIDERTGPTLDGENQKQVQHSPEQVQHSPITGPTSGNHPSFPSKEPSREREPSADAKPNRSPSHSSEEPKAKDGGHEKTKAEQDKNNRRTIDAVIERAKALSNGKACFSKTARIDLLNAIRDLGGCDRQELDDAINAKLDLCRDDVSYAIFGSNLAADLVASVRSKRQRIAKARKKVEDERLGNQWRDDFRAIWDDLSIDLDEWIEVNQPAGDAGYYAEALDEEAHKYRADLARRNPDPDACDADGVKLHPTADDLFGRIQEPA